MKGSRMDYKYTIWLGYAMTAAFTWMGVVDLVRGKWVSGALFLLAVAIVVLGMLWRNHRSS